MLHYFRPVHKLALTIAFCLLALFSNSQTTWHTWVKTYGNTSSDQGKAIARDALGNVYTTGFFNTAITFGSTTYTAVSSSDVFLTKHDGSGNLLWSTAWGGTSADNGFGVTVDASGNVFVTGSFTGTCDFDPGSGNTATVAAGSDAYISKFNASGVWQWTKTWGGTGNDIANAVTNDAAGNLYIAGNYNASASFGAVGTLNNAGAYDVFVAKMNASGNFVWAKGMGGAGEDQAYGIAVDGSNNVYTTGQFQQTADFDPGSGTVNLIAAGASGASIYSDAFVSKLNASGDYVWAKRWGGLDVNDRGTAIALDGTGNVYTVGYFIGTNVDFDPGAGTANLTASGGAVATDAYVSKLNASGDYLWAKNWGSTTADNAYGVAADAGGNVYVTGGFNGTVDFDPSAAATASFTSNGSFDAYLTKFDASGNYKWTQTWGGAGASTQDFGYAVLVNTTGAVYTTGFFSATADFDPGTGTVSFTSAGSGDVYISKFQQTFTSAPLTWLSVNGRVGSEQQAILNWSVEEVDVQEYVIEKSADGSFFHSMGTVAGKGNGKNNYTYTASNTLLNTTWYRIKQIDIDGKYTYSVVVKVMPAQSKTVVKVSPQPVVNRLTIEINNKKYLNTKAVVYDALGRIKKVILIKNYNTYVDAGAWPHGLYVLTLEDGSSIKITR